MDPSVVRCTGSPPVSLGGYPPLSSRIMITRALWNESPGDQAENTFSLVRTIR
jgi:hypothetical protein